MAIQVTIDDARNITLDDLISLVPDSRAAREAMNNRAQIEYMCSEIAAALCLSKDTPAGTIQSVRELMEHCEILRADSKRLKATEADALSMALRLLGEDESTFSPDVAEVMDRWGPLALAALDHAAGSRP
ncbi:hypothetical protein [Candidatus Macondimonas diazotrophica]|uniref:Uncharacterized protein n=1 Tax=Candidatus Macondimonas diazotrophica TaxID=2305248 RepID=A0A4Z0F5K8_9GAMM|nr:hypothetical protein [Candidatus Macondimonas diazotrophica]TFZ81239.1 hypothetical protein E4680_13235 [Candidatus Macondimonas diazotrophica]